MRTIDINFSDSLKEYQELSGTRKSEYVLNVQKIIREKIGSEFTIPNKVQAFLLNYEVKKILDKIFNAKAQRYQQVLYLNQKLSLTNVLNTVQFLTTSYKDLNFNFGILNSDDSFRPEQFKAFGIEMKIIEPKMKKEEI